MRLFAVALIAPLLLATDGSAASVTNRDAREHTLTVISGKDGDRRVLKPDEVWNDFCAEGCIVRLDDDENATYELEGSDVVSIEDGFIYYDRDDTAPSPLGPGAAPSPAGK
ncbi:MAG: hypothetical protein AB7U75_19605 [Hyphomicrobiaceae bacterium]